MPNTKAQQPYELVLSFSTAPAELQERKIRRSRHGCFNCRKRKKKCDELRPTCSACLDKCIKCVWPEGVEKVPENYKIPPVDKKLLEKRRKQPEPPSLKPPHPSSPLVFDASPQAREPDPVRIVPLESSTPEEDLMLERSTPPHPLPVVSLPMMPIYAGQVLLPSQRDKFMSAAINGFITSLGPQQTHPLLTTNATFTPFIETNPIIDRIAEACGAAFLSWSNPDLTELSSQKYAGAMDYLFDYVACNPITSQDELWLSAAFQLLCLGAKVTWGCDNLISIRSLKMSYSFIKRKMERRGRRVSEETVNRYGSIPTAIERNSLTDQFVEGLIKNDSLKMEIENTLMEYTDDESTTPFERQFERMFVESFIYNYSCAILLTPDSMGLPNPFEVFRDTRRYLKTPLFTCDVAWMNNPVLGCSFDEYELAAKASYLIRHIHEPWVNECARKLLEAADYYPPPMLPPEVRHDQAKFHRLKDSILVAEIVMKAAKIVLHKAIDPLMREYDPFIQREVRSIIFKLRQMSPVAHVRIIASWALFVAGLACVEEDHRAEVIDSCLTNGELVHGRFVYTIIDALEVAWGRPSKLGTVSLSRGLDALLDMELLTKVFI